MNHMELTSTRSRTKPISPGRHAILDYGVAAAFIAFGLSVMSRHRKAAGLAFLNGGMVLGMAMLTDYPGGVVRKLSFRGHRRGDIIQATLAALGPMLFGFSKDPEAKFFYRQAMSEAGVIAATDWDAPSTRRAPAMRQLA